MAFAANGRAYRPTGMGSGNRRKIPDFGGGLSDMLARLEARTGFKMDTTVVIADGVSFREWCEELGRNGLKAA